MKSLELFMNFSTTNDKIQLKLLSTKEKTFLNKKRKKSKEINDNDFDTDENYIPNMENLLSNKNSFENNNSSKAERLPTFLKIQNELTNVSTLNHIESQEPKSNINKITFLQQDIKLFSNENILEEKEEEINDLQNDENIIDEEKFEEKNIEIIEKKPQNYLNKRKKNDLRCLALDLLNTNGEFQIKFSKTRDSAYILKIKEVDIKDDYYAQVDYANHHRKFSKLKSTAPNNKFWTQRYYYFLKFDNGIIMDNESWYSVTPEEIAKYTAKLIKGKSVIDGFCGCGGNVIQFSKYCSKVYAIDLFKDKLDICKNNCKVYNCQNNIEFIHSDFLQMKNKIKADYIFLSPPWGGTEYKNSEIYSIKKFMHPDITEIVRVSMNVADNILFFLPRNLDLDELFDICANAKNEIKQNSGKNIFFDVQIIKSNGRIKSLLIIFGHHIKDYFNEQKLEKFLIKQKYENINENYINKIFDKIKKIGCYLFFREEYIFRTTNLKNINKPDIVDLYKYIKNISEDN